MNRPQYILLPVNPYFIAFSLAAAFLLNLMPWGRLIGIPDFVALVVLFWNVHQPRKVGMGIAFFLGLLMDVHDASLLGEHALAYTLLSYGAITIHRRVLWMPRGLQVFAVAPLLVIAQLVPFVIRSADGRRLPRLGPTRARLRRSRVVAARLLAAADAAAPSGRSGRYAAHLRVHKGSFEDAFLSAAGAQA